MRNSWSAIAPGTAINLAEALVAPDVLRQHLVNWPEVVRCYLRTVEADAAAHATPETAAPRERLLRYKDVRTTIAQAPSAGTGISNLPMHFQKGRMKLRLFIATLGTHQDITLQSCASSASPG
jgi:hypothetical protein